jgi:hypothetical protein
MRSTRGRFFVSAAERWCHRTVIRIALRQIVKTRVEGMDFCGFDIEEAKMVVEGKS